MTNQEAISVIETAKAECEWNAPLDYKIAFDMAIEALEKQSKWIPVSEEMAKFPCLACDKYGSIYEMQVEAKEEADRFIFDTILPYCNEIARMPISKEELKAALTLWAQVKSGNNLTIKMGEWKINSDGYYPYCSECGFEPKEMTNYCPKCGALMSESLKTRALGKYLVKGLTQGLFESEETTK